MNERIKELVKKAGGDFMVTFADDTETRPSKVVSVDFDPPETLEKFVKFIVDGCLSKIEDDRFELPDSIVASVKQHFGVEE
jgi:hypothetical protein